MWALAFQTSNKSIPKVVSFRWTTPEQSSGVAPNARYPLCGSGNKAKKKDPPPKKNKKRTKKTKTKQNKTKQQQQRLVRPELHNRWGTGVPLSLTQCFVFGSDCAFDDANKSMPFGSHSTNSTFASFLTLRHMLLSKCYNKLQHLLGGSQQEFGWGVRPTPWNPDPVQDTKMWILLPCLRDNAHIVDPVRDWTKKTITYNSNDALIDWAIVLHTMCSWRSTRQPQSVHWNCSRVAVRDEQPEIFGWYPCLWHENVNLYTLF